MLLEMVFLMETRLTNKSAVALKQLLGFDNSFVVERTGLGGGLLMLRNDRVKISVASSSKGHIDAMVFGQNLLPLRFTGFYGNPVGSQRKFS